MIKKGIFALVAATAVAGVASPVFGQSATSYGDVRPYYYDSGGTRKNGSWTMEEQGSSGGNRGQVSASSNRNQASGNRAQSAGRTRGYSAYGYEPRRR